MNCPVFSQKNYRLFFTIKIQNNLLKLPSLPFAGAAVHGGREGTGDADLRLQEEDRRSGDEAEAAAEPVRSGAQRPQSVQQEPHRISGQSFLPFLLPSVPSFFPPFLPTLFSNVSAPLMIVSCSKVV